MWAPNVKRNIIEWVEAEKLNRKKALNLKEKQKLMEDIEVLTSKMQIAFPNLDITQEKIIGMLNFLKQKLNLEFEQIISKKQENFFGGLSAGLMFSCLIVFIFSPVDLELVKPYLKDLNQEERRFLLDLKLWKEIIAAGAVTFFATLSQLKSYLSSRKERRFQKIVYEIEKVQNEFKNAGITEKELQSILGRFYLLD